MGIQTTLTLPYKAVLRFAKGRGFKPIIFDKLGFGLQEKECAWLIQEIQEWIHYS